MTRSPALAEHEIIAQVASGRALMAGSAALLVLALALSLPLLASPPTFDELYHVLAARGWLETGRFAIAEGEYTRTSLFTLAIALLFNALGESLGVARLPSVLAYCALAALYFAWMRRETTALAAWIASLLLVLSPFTLEAGVLARFYAVQVLAFFGAVVLLCEALRSPAGRPRRAALAAGAAGALAFAFYLQPVTAIGVGGIVLWLVIELGGPWFLKASPRKRLLCLGIAVALGAMLAGIALATGIAQEFLYRFRAAPEFQRDTVNQFWFYHLWLVLYYPVFWTSFPLLFLLSLASFPRMTRLCGSIFIVAFTLHSLAGSKDPRYLAYAYPFLFAIFGMGSAAAWPRLRDLILQALGQIAPAPQAARMRRRVELVVLTLVLTFVVLANGAMPRVAAMLAGVRIPPQPPLVNWQAAAQELAPWLRKVEVVVTNDELAALYYLGRYDVLISPSRLSETRAKRDFARDHRTGRPVIASPQALRSVVACFASGLMVADRNKMAAARPGVIDVLTRETRPLALPRHWAVDAYVWENGGAPVRSSFCDSIIHGAPPAT